MPIHVKVLSAEDYSAWVDGKKKKAPPRPTIPSKVWTLADLMARGERSTPPTAPPATKDGKGAGPIKALDGSPPSCRRRQAGSNRRGAQRPRQRRMPAWKQLSDTEIAALDHLHEEQLVQQDRPGGAAG